MNKITVSAPGKLVLLGEHAVVYNRPCLVTAVNQRMKVTVEVLDTKDFQLEAPDVKITGYKKEMSQVGVGDIPKGAQFVEIAVKNFFEKYPINNTGLRITTASEFSAQLGFGSSSASTVCTIKALSELYKRKLSNKEIFDLAYKTVLEIQKKGSGVDVAAGVYGGTLFFVTAGQVIESLNIDSLPLIVGYSGIKVDTVTMINQVKVKANKFPEIIEEIYNAIEDVVLFAKEALLVNDFATVGELMDINQGFLAALGVSTKKLTEMIYSVREAGAFGAKLSGGGGDCMITLAGSEKRKMVEEAIVKAGGEVISVEANAEGVRVEK